jgi:RimJ/RimL family protein N-acetyltransferase
VFCGGSDPKNLTKTVLDALSGDEFSDLAVDVVIGAQNQNYKPGSTNQFGPNIQFHESGDDFAKVMSNSDLAIGAGGTTTWERMCLGVPSIIVSIAENQVPTCEKLGREGLVRYLGPQSEVSIKSVASAVREFSKTPSALSASSIKSQIVVDGKGCKRVAESMCPTSENELKVRLATKPDCIDYFNWANDPQVRENSLDSVDIEWTGHQKWFTEKINSESTEMYVLEASGLPVGQIRFEIVDKTAEIGYSLDELVRGRGWAATAVDLSVKCFRNRNAIPLKAVVKNRNASSRSTFFKLGFTEVSAVLPPPAPQFSIAFISDEGSWFNSYLKTLKLELLTSGHKIMHVHNESELKSADLCFYLSFSKIATKKSLAKFKHNLVVHSSNLPNGRGWSPLTWQILEGKKVITTSLFEAEEDVDRGKIYLQRDLEFSGFELLGELRMLQGNLIVGMCSEFIQTYPDVLLHAQEQDGEGSYYSRRRPADSELNPDLSIREQLNLFRVADNSNYPAYVEIDQHHYEFWIKKKEEK